MRAGLEFIEQGHGILRVGRSGERDIEEDVAIEQECASRQVLLDESPVAWIMLSLV